MEETRLLLQKSKDELIVPVWQATTLDATIWVVKSIESMIKGRTIDRAEVSKKRKFDGSSVNKKKKKRSFKPNSKKKIRKQPRSKME